MRINRTVLPNTLGKELWGYFWIKTFVGKREAVIRGETFGALQKRWQPTYDENQWECGLNGLIYWKPRSRILQGMSRTFWIPTSILSLKDIVHLQSSSASALIRAFPYEV